ncbi:hypothetical protein EZV62_003653 [Acer yangbiense]|uniref:CCHC-type domain-containing protein n=1 Tax=Acer yangbiense TaxID=1000413 RepID=A0A5C7IHX4_9ROSI|nr:hypothetical protein EZV62_003653 [Acer yangbiense]
MVTKQDFEQSNHAINDKITAVQNDLRKQILDLTNEMRDTFTLIEARFTDFNTHHPPRDKGKQHMEEHVTKSTMGQGTPIPGHRHPSSSNIGFRALASRPRHAFRGLPTEDHDVRRPPNLLPCQNVESYKNPYDDRRDFHRRSYDNHFDPARRVKVDAPEFDGRLDANVFLDWLAAMDDYFEWLREKYLPTYYRSALLDQYLNIKQSSSSVNDYMSVFDDLLIRCNIKEEPDVTVARFINGLKFELKRVVSIHNPETLEDAYSKILEVEKYLRPYPSRTGLPSLVHPYNPNIECHHCHAKGHIASRCPQRTLTIGQEYDDYYPPDPTDEVVKPIEDIHDLDLEADLDDREFEGPSSSPLPCIPLLQPIMSIRLSGFWMIALLHLLRVVVDNFWFVGTDVLQLRTLGFQSPKFVVLPHPYWKIIYSTTCQSRVLFNRGRMMGKWLGI